MYKTIGKFFIAISLSVLTSSVAWATCTSTTTWKDPQGNTHTIYQGEGNNDDSAFYSSGTGFRPMTNTQADTLIKEAKRKGRRVIEYPPWNAFDGPDSDCY
jgi:hypothetical protein